LHAAFLLPDSFASTSRVLIKAKPDSPNIAAKYDPYLLQTQFEFIHSLAVLQPVVEQLNLNEFWGKKYFAGQMLKTSESLEILKNRIALSPVKNTMLISIQVFSDDKNEAATLANAIADSYLNQTKNGQATTSVQDSQVSGSLGLAIIEKAMPGRYAVKPNRPLTAIMGALFGLVLAGIIGGLAAFITSVKRKRRQSANAPA
jgi:capsular polysaccharide biosynthesis protein